MLTVGWKRVTAVQGITFENVFEKEQEKRDGVKLVGPKLHLTHKRSGAEMETTNLVLEYTSLCDMVRTR